MKKSDQLKSKNGAALIFVVVALCVLTLMISISIFVSRSNLRQASAQEQSIQAFYVARSGVELAYEALLTTNLLDNFKNDSTNTYSLGPQTVSFDVGTATVNVTSSGSGDTKKILIRSVGELNNGGLTRTISLEFYARYDLYPDIKWSN